MTADTSRNEDNITLLRSVETSIWIDHQKDSIWTVEAFVRAPGGLYYLDQTYTGTAPTVAQIAADAQAHGEFSPRPCRLGRPVDPSMGHCALALFHHYCKTWNLDAHAILDKAYPKAPSFRELDFRLIAEQANWEGLDYPQIWSPGVFSLLLEFLYGTGTDELADYLEKHPKGSVPRLS
jgi:hypothetical protein